MRITACNITVFFLLLILGCSHDPVSQDPVSKLTQYHGQTRAAVISQLGPPTRTDQFAMQDAAGEFRVELYNTYPPSNPANATTEIQELWWDDGEYWITLWLHQMNGQWVVLDSCRWDKNVRF